MMGLTWILIALFVCTKPDFVHLEERSRILIPGPQNSMGAKGLQPEDCYLHEIKALSEKGRFFNQTEKDFEALKPSCTCLNSCDDDDCCYCDFECPVPQNPFTRELLLPRTSKCWQNRTSHNQLLGKRESKPLFASLCDRLEDAHDYKSRFAAVFCIHNFNLGMTKFFFDINPGWTPMLEKDRSGSTSYNWQKQITHDENEGQSRNTSLDKSPEDLLSLIYGVDDETLLDKIAEDLVNLTARYQVGHLNFTRDDRNLNTTGLVYLNVSSAKGNFNVKTSPQCAKLQEGSMEECSYSIIAVSDYNCTVINDLINATAQIVSYLLTGNDSLKWISSDANPVKDKNESCCAVPTHGKLTVVGYREVVIGVFSQFEYEEYEDYNFLESNELIMKFSLSSYQIPEKQFANLPRFWSEIIYAKCPEQYCWKDLLKMHQEDASRIGSLDHHISKSIMIYIVLPLVPIFAYLWVQKAF